MSTLAELAELIEQGHESRSAIDKLLVNGQLLVTPEQFDQLRDIARQWEPRNGPLSKVSDPLHIATLWGIPILVIHSDDQPRDLGKGLMATNLNGNIYVWKKSDLLMTMTRIGLHDE